MQYKVQYSTTVYHSRDWEYMVSQGWITMEVEIDPEFGYRKAKMIRQVPVPDPFGRW